MLRAPCEGVPSGTAMISWSVTGTWTLVVHPDSVSVPTVGEWGLIVLTLSLLTAGTILFTKLRAVVA